MAHRVGTDGVAKTGRPASSAVFRRERLFRALDQNRSAACTWIAGPPGSGKTALAASFVDERSFPTLWYQVDPDDGDPSAFFARMTAVVDAGSHAGTVVLPSLTPDAGFSLPTFARMYFRALFASTPDLMIVLDDYHEAPADCPLHEIVRVAIEQVPAGAHMAVASRMHPPPALARMQANEALRVIGWDQLMLTADEVVGIAGLHDTALDPLAAEEWRGRCGGWAAGLRLLLRPNVPPQARIAYAESRTVLFDYFGQEVFRELPEAFRSDLVRLAFLPRISADIVNELAHSRSTQHELAALARDNLFTTQSLESGMVTYRLHPLFRDFLIHRARSDLSETEVKARQHRAGAALEAAGLLEEAAQVWVDAQSWDHLGRLVLEHAGRLMAQGRQMTLAQWLNRLPSKSLDADPWLRYWHGASRALHDPATARVSLGMAFDLFAALQQREGLLLAWSGVVDCTHQIAADFRLLDGWIARLEDLLRAHPSFPSPQVEARVTFSMFIALSFRQPQHPDLPMWRQRLDAITTVAPDPMFCLFARFHLTWDQIWQGDLHGAGADLEKLKRDSRRLPMSPLVELVGHFADATYALYTGQVQRCFDSIESALAVAESSGIHNWDGILLGQGAALALSNGDLTRGLAYARRRDAIIKPAHEEDESLHHAIGAWSCWLTGARAEALAHVRLGNGCVDRLGVPQFSALHHLAVAIVSFECGEPDVALGHVGAGRVLGLSTRNPMIGWMADLLEAYMRLRRGENATALVEACMSAGQRCGYRHFFFWPRHAAARVCLEALESGIQADYATELVRTGHLDPPPEAFESDRWPWPVTVRTLGSFCVEVRGSPVTFKGKVQRAPLALLKVLIALGGHEVAESSIVDALWPDSDGDAGKQALATTLFRLRRLVGAEVLKRHDGHLSIVEAECWVDARAVERLLGSRSDDPDAVVEWVKRLYAGPFLRGEDEASWTLPLRERLHVAVVRKIAAAAAAALGQGRVASASAMYELGLDIDDLVEEFYRGQIRCYMANNESSLVASVYQRCRRSLASRLGVEPSAATTRLYLAAIHRTDV